MYDFPGPDGGVGPVRCEVLYVVAARKHPRVINVDELRLGSAGCPAASLSSIALKSKASPLTGVRVIVKVLETVLTLAVAVSPVSLVVKSKAS